MKHWFIRLAGAILSIFPFINRATAYYTDNATYSATLSTVKNRWYVGWQNPNTAGNTPDSFKNSVFMGEHWENASSDKAVRQPMVKNASGHVVISSGTYYLLNPGVDNKYRESRVGGDGRNYYQHLLYRSISTSDNSVKLIYAPTTGFFKAAGCCQLNVCYNGYTGGSCRSFSYSGNGESAEKCPCFYLPGDISYSGNGSANCRGARYTGHMVEGPYAYSGAGLTSGGGWYFQNDMNVSLGCPPIVTDALVCFKHTSCKDGSYHSYSFDKVSGCDAFANLLGGMANVKTDVSAISGASGSEVYLGGLLPMTCYAGQMDGWCTPGYGLKYMTQSSADSDPQLCQECPAPSSSSVGGLPLNNKNAGSTGYVIGLSACYVSKPTATDDSGTFEFTTSAGSAQTCYYKN